MYKRILSDPLKNNKSFFLLGPRGTGKTQWLREKLPKAIYIDLLDSPLYRLFLANPSHLITYIPVDYKGWVVIDEIQRVPELLNEVHRLIEEKSYLFAMSGSSTRKLRRAGVNLLAGRALVYHMHPLIMQEIGKDFVLKNVLEHGLLPAVLKEKQPSAFLEAYVQTYLREEVIQEGLTRNLGAFSHFLEVASFSQGQILNKSNIAREVATNHKTITNYFNVLEDLLLAHFLPVFNKRAQRAVIQHPKFYYFDVGVYNAIRPKGPLDGLDILPGTCLETLFFQSLHAVNQLYGYGYKLYYWRTKTGLEVDFILYGKRGLIAFEIKNGKQIHTSSTKNLLSFSKEYPIAKTYLIYRGNHERSFNGIHAIPIHAALSRLHELLA